jgi:hypothetical protein
VLNSYVETCIYPETAFGGGFDPLPGVQLHDLLECNFEISHPEFYALRRKVEQSTRKLCMMWHAAEEAVRAEQVFYQSTIKEAPALFGEDAVRIYYHLEAMVLFARSAMDVASTAFGLTLPDPFVRKRYDSFNNLIKTIAKLEKYPLAEYFQPLRRDDVSWVSVIAGTERGRSLRDKIAHQTDFPIDYIDIGDHTEKRHAVVSFGGGKTPLPVFTRNLCQGVVDGYLKLEEQSLHHIRRIANDDEPDI